MTARLVGSTVIGRDAAASDVWAAVERGTPAVITGVAGVGRTTVMRHALSGRRARFGGALATASFRPYLALERALDATAPASSSEVVAWVLEQCSGRVLALDDLHLAHPATVEAVYDLSAALPVVLTVATGTTEGDALLSELAGWGAFAPTVVHLEPLADDDATEVARLADPSLGDAELAALVAFAGGRPGFLVAGREARGAAALESLSVAERTSLVAAALVARPCERTLLGPGVDGLVETGLAWFDDAGDVVVVGPVAMAALERTVAADRVAVHEAVAARLPHGEAARHLRAAGNVLAAAERALRAADAAEAPLERAGHLHFAATCHGSPDIALRAATALLAIGDVHTVTTLAPSLAAAGPEGNLCLARASRLAGNSSAAAEAVRGGLVAAKRGTDTWRRLLVEAVWTSPPGALELAVEIASRATDGTTVAVLAAVAAALVPHRAAPADVDTLLGLDIGSLDVPDRFHAGLLVGRALLRAGRSLDAAEAADAVAEMARAEHASVWVDVARAEASWARYLYDGDAASLLVADGVRSGRATVQRMLALLHLVAVDHDPAAAPFGPSPEDATADASLWHAIAAEAHFALGDTDEAAVHAALAGLPVADPVVGLLTGPVAIAATRLWGVPLPDLAAFAPLAAEAGALADGTSGGDPTRDAWSTSMARGVVRGLLADGERDQAAQRAVAAGLRRWADRCGVIAGGAASGSGALTARERQVLSLVGAGCTTPVIARRLGIAPSTVESHVKNARTKLGVRSRAGAAAGTA